MPLLVFSLYGFLPQPHRAAEEPLLNVSIQATAPLCGLFPWLFQEELDASSFMLPEHLVLTHLTASPPYGNGWSPGLISQDTWTPAGRGHVFHLCPLNSSQRSPFTKHLKTPVRKVLWFPELQTLLLRSSDGILGSLHPLHSIQETVYTLKSMHLELTHHLHGERSQKNTHTITAFPLDPVFLQH